MCNPWGIPQLRWRVDVNLLNDDRISRQFFTSLAPEQIAIAETPETAIALTREILAAQSMTSS